MGARISPALGGHARGVAPPRKRWWLPSSSLLASGTERSPIYARRYFSALLAGAGEAADAPHLYGGAGHLLHLDRSSAQRPQQPRGADRLTSDPPPRRRQHHE